MADPKPPAELTAEEWRALADELEDSAKDMAAEGRHAVVWRAKVAAHALRAMAVACATLQIRERVVYVGEGADAVIVMNYDVYGEGPTLAAALLNAAGEG